MANDPGLAADTLTYMEAVAGDQGVHDPAGVWWLSPDIQLVGSVSGPDKADPGVDNTVTVAIHAGLNGSLPPGTESLTIELFVANPSLFMAPNNSASTAHIDSIGMQLMPPGGSESYQFHWIPGSGLPATDPQSSGHKCLIARAYADPLYPSSMSFFAPDDPHVAQHNICVVPCGGPGAARKPGPCGQRVWTINPGKQKSHRIRIRAVADLEPSKGVLGIVKRALKGTRGFGQISTRPPRSFSIQTRETSRAKASKVKGAPAVQIEPSLEPGELTELQFTADLTGGKLGDAYIFHVTQTGAEGSPQGGLTIVMVSV